MSTTLSIDDRVREVGEEIKSKKGEQAQAWAKFDRTRIELAKAGTDDDTALSVAEDAHKEYSVLTEEVTALEAKRDRLWALTPERGKTDAGSREREGHEALKERFEQQMRGVTFGSRIAAGELYKAATDQGVWKRNQGSRVGEVQLGEMMTRDEFFALVTGGSDTSAGALINPDRKGYFQSPDRPLLITDLISVGQTDSDTVEFVRMTSFTNNAAAVPEATDVSGVSGLKPQSDLALEKVSEPVRTLAHWIATTRKALADAAQIRSMIDGRLRMGLLQVLETQLISGNGVGENLLGITAQPGILAHPVGSDTLVDALHKAITKVRLKFYEPSAVAINALDWESIRLAKDANDNYYYGPPALAGAQTIWGKPVAVGAQFAEGNPVVADFSQIELYIREGIQVLASDSHADFFIRNLIALLAEMRVALAVPMPEAICEVTSA